MFHQVSVVSSISYQKVDVVLDQDAYRETLMDIKLYKITSIR